MSQSKLNQISPHVYWLPPDSTTDRPVLGVVAGERSTLLVDAGNSPAHARLFLAEVARLPVALPQFLVLTHWHWDHIFGAATIGLPTLAHQETRRRLVEMAGWDWSDAALDKRVAAGVEIEFCRDMIKAELPDRSDLILRPPDIAFTRQVELDLGGISAQLIHVGGDHAPDSIIVFIPEERVVFMSDCLAPDLYHPPRRYTPRRLFPLMDQLLRCEADFYLMGHNPEPVSRAELETYTSRLRLIGQLVERLGPNRAAILAELGRFDQDDEEDLDCFLAGLEGK
ncbi:MAG: Zn-dependent hydrolase [Chloroflexota bacterium]|nr:MAG: Zn-dependent hydrolase [Chloroflexota bacterium]